MSRASVPFTSEISVSTFASTFNARIARMVSATCCIPPSAKSSRATIVSTANSSCIRCTASATRRGSSASGSNGFCVSIKQNPHALVHLSPSTINVAVPSFQHSLRFGQPACSHTVTKFKSRNVRFVFNTSSVCFTCGRIHSGLRIEILKPSVTPACSRRLVKRTCSPAPSPRENAERSSGRCFHATSARVLVCEPQRN